MDILVESGTVPETNIAPEKGIPKKKIVFQASIFRCYVSFKEGNWIIFSTKPSKIFEFYRTLFCLNPTNSDYQNC